MVEIGTADALYHRLSKENVASVVCFKAVWCKTCARLQYTIKKTAEANPEVQFLNLDVSDRSGELYDFFAGSNLHTIPYFLVYVNNNRVSEGRWSEIRVPRDCSYPGTLKPKVVWNSQGSAPSSGCVVMAKDDASSPDHQKDSGCTVRPKMVSRQQEASKMTQEARSR